MVNMANNQFPQTHRRPRRRQRRYVLRGILVVLILIVFTGTVTGLVGYHHGKHQAELASNKSAVRTALAYQKKLTNLRMATHVPKLATYFQTRLAELAVRANYVGVAQIYYDHHLVASWQSGYANRQSNQLNTAATGYEINSLQKGMTGTLLMNQVALGKVNLSDRLSQFYPNVPHSDQITLRQMLNMTSGLSTPRGYNDQRVQSDQEVIQNAIAKTRFIVKQYNEWSYQPINYILLAGITEKVSGKSYAELFKTQIIDKLKLKHTHFSYELPTNYLHATGYNFTTKASPQTAYAQPLGVVTAQKHSELGTGQVYMTAADLYHVESGMLDGTLMTTAARNELFVDGSQSHYGGYYNYATYKGVNGAGSGFQSRVHISPDGKNAMVLLTNHPANFLNLDKLSNTIDGLLF